MWWVTIVGGKVREDYGSLIAARDISGVTQKERERRGGGMKVCARWESFIRCAARASAEREGERAAKFLCGVCARGEEFAP